MDILSRRDIIKRDFDFSRPYNDVEFRDVLHKPQTVNDCYRIGKTYKIFRSPGRSQVLMEFPLRKSEVESIKDISIRLNHCSASTDGSINIFLNDTIFYEGHLSPKWSFQDEVFRFDEGFRIGMNVIKIILNEECSGVYWLSRAVISLSLRSPKSLKDQSGEFINGQGVDYASDDIPQYLQYFLESLKI